MECCVGLRPHFHPNSFAAVLSRDGQGGALLREVTKRLFLFYFSFDKHEYQKTMFSSIFGCEQ